MSIFCSVVPTEKSIAVDASNAAMRDAENLKGDGEKPRPQKSKKPQILQKKIAFKTLKIVLSETVFVLRPQIIRYSGEVEQAK
jgi:hypothetical protein